jgi:hypothetical protein
LLNGSEAVWTSTFWVCYAIINSLNWLKSVIEKRVSMTYRDQLNKLTKILVDTELKNTQNEFSKKNCSIFVDKEENKHDYNKIHGK